MKLSEFFTIVDNMNISDDVRVAFNTLQKSYITDLRRDVHFFQFCHYFLSISIGFASIILAVIITLEKLSSTYIPPTASIVIFWINFSLSILIAFSKFLMESLNISRKYILNYATYERILSEIRQWATSIGKYRRYQGDLTRSFRHLCTKIENIRMTSLESILEMGGEDEEQLTSLTVSGLSKESFGKSQEGPREGPGEASVTPGTVDIEAQEIAITKPADSGQD